MTDLDRRELLIASAAVAVGCKTAGDDVAPAAPGSARIRVASVATAVEGNILPALIADFEKVSPYRVDLTPSSDLYDLARAGKADLCLSHYGHRDAEQFVIDGLGEFPRMVFSNQMALVGPPSDPAKIKNVADAGEAFRRIAATKSPFLVNELDGVRYLIEILWNAAGRPDRAGWLRDHSHDDALITAGKIGAYTLWGLTPFLRVRKRERVPLEPLVLADPLLQRMLVTIVVKPANPGASALQTFLLEPATQARMRDIRYSDDEPVVCWVPAGRHNRTAILPKG
jgi:tungstate transport system substrate-binding protein